MSLEMLYIQIPWPGLEGRNILAFASHSCHISGKGTQSFAACPYIPSIPRYMECWYSRNRSPDLNTYMVIYQ